MHGHSPLHRLAPECKTAAVFGFVVAAAVTPGEAAWAFGVYALAVAGAARLGRIRLRFILARLAAAAPFILFAFLIPFVAAGERVEIWGVGVSRPGLWAAWAIIAKSVIGASAGILLAAVTEVPEIIRGLRRLRVPAMLVSIAGFMVRYLELIAEELGRMRIAMLSRGWRGRGARSVRPLAGATGAMFVRSYERGERVYAAMLSRGYTGEMPDVFNKPAPRSHWLACLSVPLAAAAVAVLARVTL